MDEVLEKLESTLICKDAEDEAKTNFEGLYKNWGRLGNQEERRKEVLKIQKGNRNNKLDKFRGILELVNAVEQHEIFRSYNRAFYRPTIYVAGFNKTSPTYSNVLMMSEWMIEKPEDFNENWYVVPCPKGVRMLVVANQGTTKCYTKYGHFRYEHRTALPGGNRCDSNMKNRCCVLDCFYYDKTNTMYILDLLAWNCHSMTDGETEFRHYWLESQLAEVPGLNIISKRNKMIFKQLPKVSCDKESFNKFMMQYPMFDQNCPPLDGFLFYHKRAHYVAGETPLVGWLFPYMVPEVLGSEFTVNSAYLLEKPASYVNQAEFIQKFEAKNAKKSRSRRTSTNSMDTAEIKNSDETKNDGEIEKIDEDVTKNEADEKIDADENKTDADVDNIDIDVDKETEQLEKSNAKAQSETQSKDTKKTDWTDVMEAEEVIQTAVPEQSVVE